MGLRPVFARFATLVCAFALFAGTVLFARYAMADGREGRRPPPTPPPQQETYVPTTPDIPELAGGAPVMPAQAPVGGQPCLSTEEAYIAISQATAGVGIDAINAALAEVEADPSGANSDLSQASLANRLRIALGLSPQLPPCETVLAALHDSVQLAQIASAAGEGPETGGIGEPPPLSPNYSPIPPGAPGGARGHGYCPSISTGCQG